MSKISEKLYLKRVFSQFDFIGTPKEIETFKELLTMLSTTPTGKVILDNLLKINSSSKTAGLKKLISMLPQAPISKAMFEEAFRNKIFLFFAHNPKSRSDGSFYPETNSIELFYQDIHDPALSDKERLEAKISRVVALTHELQHAVMINAIRQTNLGRRSEKEALLADRILEAAAYFSDGEVKKELAQLYPQIGPSVLSKKIQQYAYKKRYSSVQRNGDLGPSSDSELDKYHFFCTAYQGENELVEGSISLERGSNKEKRQKDNPACPTQKTPPPKKGTKKDFWDGIQDVLDQMHVNIPRHQLLDLTWRSTVYPKDFWKKTITKPRKIKQR